MKKNFFIISLSIVTILSGVVTSFKYCNSLSTCALYSENVEVLTQGEAIDPYQLACVINGGNWNMATTCTDSGFESYSCTVKGEISAFGITLKGEYQKGKSYSLPWARYTCTASNGNCCVKQGLYTGETKIA